MGAQGFAHGQRRDPHPRTHPGDEHPLTSLQAALYHQHFKHHDGGEWNGRGLIPIQIVGHLHGLAWGHEDIFCKGAWGPSHHPVTRRKTRDPKPATHHFAGRFHANGLGCSRLVQSMPQDKFTAVEPRGSHVNEDLTGTCNGPLHLAKLYLRLHAIALHPI